MISVTAKLKTYSVLLSVIATVQAVSVTSATTWFSPITVCLIPDDRALSKDKNWLFPVTCGEFCHPVNKAMSKGQSSQNEQKSCENRNYGNLANYLATNHTNNKLLPKADRYNENIMILPPKPMTRCFLHQKDQFKMVFRKYRAALKMSSDSEMETEVQQEAIEASNNMETNDSQHRTSEAEASLSHPGANHGDSSSAMLVGYTTMEEGVQKEAGLDENSNVHGNVHTHTHNFIYSDFAVGSTESESELDESTEAEATRMSRIITTTRGIARRVHEIMEATTESDGISDVTSIFLSETERILTFGNHIRARVAQNPKLVERVAQLQLLTRPPSPPRSNHDSGEEGDDEEEAAVEAGLGTGGADEHDQDDVFVHGHVTPPQSDNDSSLNIELSPSCKFTGYGNLSIACTCISISNSSVSQMSIISVGTPEPAEIGDVDETDDDDSVKFVANVQGKPKEIKIETSSDDSMKCTRHVIRRRPAMTGEGAYNNLVQEARAADDDVTKALKRSKMA